MTFRHPKFDFVDAGGLHVAYRESPEPQVVHVEAALGGKPEHVIGMLALVSGARSGCGALSADLAARSTAEILSGPRKPGDAGFDGETLAWDLEVTAVSTRFMKVFVEHLALVAGVRARPKSLTITGALPLDDSAASCRTADVVGWLLDPDSAPPVIGALPFAATVKTAASVKAARLKLTGASAFTEEQYGAFRGTWLSSWLCPLGVGLNLAADGPADPGAAKCAHAGVEITCKFTKLDVRRKPAESMLLNLLAKFHATVAPLEKAEIVLA